MGAEFAKDVAEKTNKIGGDGTTTAIILFYTMASNGLKYIEKGLNAISFKNYMQKVGNEVVEFLKGLAKPIKDDADILQIAVISSESEELGKIVADAVIAVGANGIVDIDEGQAIGVTTEIKKGLEISQGYVSQYLANNSEMTESEYRDVPILITDERLADVPELIMLADQLIEAEIQELVLVAEDIEGDALSTIILTKLRGSGTKILAIKAPGFGDAKKEYLRDLAVVTGGKVLSGDEGFSFDSFKAEDLKSLGYADKVVANKDTTLFVGGKGAEKDLKEYTDNLLKRVTSSKSNYDKDSLKTRVAKITGGIATIKVGASSESEMVYLKDKLEDAVNATQSAIAEGVIAGGGSALVRASHFLLDIIEAEGKTMGHEELVAYKVVASALQEPLKQIMKNAGREDEQIVIGTIKINPEVGYEAKNNILIDVVKAGIIDPVRVTRAGVENAISASGILLTTEVAIAELSEEE